jgi:hypothetical protein
MHNKISGALGSIHVRQNKPKEVLVEAPKAVEPEVVEAEPEVEPEPEVAPKKILWMTDPIYTGRVVPTVEEDEEEETDE